MKLSYSEQLALCIQIGKSLDEVITVADVLSARNRRANVFKRVVCAHILVAAGVSKSEVSRFLDLDHTTVLYYLTRYKPTDEQKAKLAEIPWHFKKEETPDIVNYMRNCVWWIEQHLMGKKFEHRSLSASLDNLQEHIDNLRKYPEKYRVK